MTSDESTNYPFIPDGKPRLYGNGAGQIIIIDEVSKIRPATTAEIMEAYYDIRNAESPVIWMPRVEIEQDIHDGLYWLRVNDSPFIYFTNKEQAERMKNLLIHQLISHRAEL